jgi:DNA modification methylase
MALSLEMTREPRVGLVSILLVSAGKHLHVTVCIEVLKRLPRASIDLILTDPPYVVRYQDRGGRKIANDDNTHWIRPAFTELYRVLKPDRYCLSFYGWGRAGRFLWAWRECGFHPVGHFVFIKSYASRTSHTRMHHEQAYLLAVS